MTPKLSFRALAIVAAIALSGASSAPATTTIYVDDDAPPGGNGGSWSSPLNSLVFALAIAEAISDQVEIRVAQGVYRPDVTPDAPKGTGDRTATFRLTDWVTLRGGYAGPGSGDPDAWDPDAYETVLTGDLAGNDLGFDGNDENALHVVTADGVNAATTIEGVVITGGNANIAKLEDQGAGLRLVDSDLTILRCSIEWNHAGFTGGGGGVFGGSPRFDRCRIHSNYAASAGAGLYAIPESLTVVDCELRGNESLDGVALTGAGGAIYIRDGHLAVVRSVVADNVAIAAGAIYASIPGTIRLENVDLVGNRGTAIAGGAFVAGSFVIVEGCSIRANRAGIGGSGGLHVHSESGLQVRVIDTRVVENSSEFITGGLGVSAPVALTNCVISRNSAGDDAVGGGLTITDAAVLRHCSISENRPDGINVLSGSANIANSIIWNESGLPAIAGHTAVVRHSIISGGYPGNGNLSLDPSFVQPGADDLRLAVGSPGIDSGSNAHVPDGLETDIDGLDRIQNGIVDRGAHEGESEPAPEAVAASDVDAGEAATLIFDGALFFDPLRHDVQFAVNESGTDDAWVVAERFPPGHRPAAPGGAPLGRHHRTLTNLAIGEVRIIAFIAFTADDLLPLVHPRDLDLLTWDEETETWALAVRRNQTIAPGHATPIGTRQAVIGPPAEEVTFGYGDFGVYYDQVQGLGYAWAVLDGPREIAIGATPCRADCGVVPDGAVGFDDLLELLGAWGTDAWVFDLDADGDVGTTDLVALLAAWGACPG